MQSEVISPKPKSGQEAGHHLYLAAVSPIWMRCQLDSKQPHLPGRPPATCNPPSSPPCQYISDQLAPLSTIFMTIFLSTSLTTYLSTSLTTWSSSSLTNLPHTFQTPSSSPSNWPLCSSSSWPSCNPPPILYSHAPPWPSGLDGW